MQKGTATFSVILIIFILAVVLAVLAYFNQTLKKISNNELSSPGIDNIKTYVNKELGFQFKYQAKNLTIKEDSEEEFNKRGNGDFRKNFKGYVGYEPKKVLGAVAVLDETSSFDTNLFTVWVFDNPEQLDIKNWFEKYWFYPFLWGVFAEPAKGHIRPQNIATISGQTTEYVTVSYQTGSPKYLYLSKNGMMYLFRIIGEIGDKVLATFQFLSQASETSDTKVCIQIITPAKNLKSGECKEFPTPCDVPDGWEQVESCSSNKTL